MKKLIGEVGNWVDGERFWGRELELEKLQELLREGANVSILAQRRIGKTSLMREAANRLASECACLHVDVQSGDSPEDFIVALGMATRPHASMWEKTKKAFASTFNAVVDGIESLSVGEVAIQLRAGMTRGTWQEKGSQMLGHLATLEMPVVLFIDELPILINRLLGKDKGKTTGKDEADGFLSWLRAQAVAHKGGIRMVFAGSIGLEPVLRRVGLSANLNHLTPFLLEPWTDPVALGCIRALAAYRGIEIADDAGREMLSLLGCNIPHHVQMFFSHVRDHCVRNEITACAPSDVISVFNNKMLSSQGHLELSHMEERLRMVLGDDAFPLASDILTQAAIKGGIGIPQAIGLCERYAVAEAERAALLRRLFEIFEHDGYLRKAGGGYVFVSNLLRQWWRARNENFFTVVEEGE